MSARKRSSFCGTAKWSLSRLRRFTDWRPTLSIQMGSPKFSRQKNDRIPLIVDGGATEHGVASHIVQIANGMIEVLRSGPITDEMLRQFGEVREQISSATISAPGQLPRHYAPRTKLIVVDDLKNFSPPSGKRIGTLCFSSVAAVSGRGPASYHGSI